MCLLEDDEGDIDGDIFGSQESDVNDDILTYLDTQRQSSNEDEIAGPADQDSGLGLDGEWSEELHDVLFKILQRLLDNMLHSYVNLSQNFFITNYQWKQAKMQQIKTCLKSGLLQQQTISSSSFKWI